MDWNVLKENMAVDQPVVPYIGTWIETYPVEDGTMLVGRTLYRYVDWNEKEYQIDTKAH